MSLVSPPLAVSAWSSMLWSSSAMCQPKPLTSQLLRRHAFRPHLRSDDGGRSDVVAFRIRRFCPAGRRGAGRGGFIGCPIRAAKLIGKLPQGHAFVKVAELPMENSARPVAKSVGRDGHCDLCLDLRRGLIGGGVLACSGNLFREIAPCR